MLNKYRHTCINTEHCGCEQCMLPCMFYQVKFNIKELMTQNKCERCINNSNCNLQEYSTTCKYYQMNPTKEKVMPACPKGYTKAMLLKSVDAINTVADVNIRVKSKTTAQMVDVIADAVREVDCVVIAEDLDQDSMECLIAFNILSGFCDEDTYSDKLVKGLKSIDDDTAQATNPVVYDEDAEIGDGKDDDDVVEEKPGKKDKKDKKDKKKKGKKGKKESSDDEDEDDDKPKGDPEELVVARGMVETLRDQVENGGLKKKKLKKAKAALESAEAELAEMEIANNKDKPKDKDKDKDKPQTDKKKRPGVIATIAEVLKDSGEYMTADEILEELVDRLPEGNPDTMIKTVKAQLYCRQAPCRMEKEKGFEIKIKGEGKERAFKAK